MLDVAGTCSDLLSRSVGACSSPAMLERKIPAKPLIVQRNYTKQAQASRAKKS